MSTLASNLMQLIKDVRRTARAVRGFLTSPITASSKAALAAALNARYEVWCYERQLAHLDGRFHFKRSAVVTEAGELRSRWTIQGEVIVDEPFEADICPVGVWIVQVSARHLELLRAAIRRWLWAHEDERHSVRYTLMEAWLIELMEYAKPVPA